MRCKQKCTERVLGKLCLPDKRKDINGFLPSSILYANHKHTGWAPAASCCHETTSLEGKPRESQRHQPWCHFARNLLPLTQQRPPFVQNTVHWTVTCSQKLSQLIYMAHTELALRDVWARTPKVPGRHCQSCIWPSIRRPSDSNQQRHGHLLWYTSHRMQLFQKRLRGGVPRADAPHHRSWAASKLLLSWTAPLRLHQGAPAGYRLRRCQWFIWVIPWPPGG